MNNTIQKVNSGNTWIISNTFNQNIGMFLNQFQTFSTTNATSSKQLYLNHWQDDTDIEVIMPRVSREDIRGVLEGMGYPLSDGSVLKIKDGKPIIEHRHTDGSEKLRPIPVSHYGTIDFSDSDHHLGPNSVVKLPDGTYLQIDSEGNLILESFINARDKTMDVTDARLSLYESLAFCHFGDIHIPEGADTDAVFTLPNGVKIKLFRDDHIEIDESDGRQLYKSEPVRDFNKFLNASDLLEQFIHYCAGQNITRKGFAELPISLFIYWLIVQAGEADGDSTVETVPLLTSAVKEHKYHPSRCKCCGQFIAKKLVANGINFCSSAHMQQHMDKL